MTLTTAVRSDHTHSRAAYQAGRRNCLLCRVENARYAADGRAARAAGRPALVPADPVRQHVRGLMGAGMPWQEIAAQAGVSAGAVERLLYDVGGRPRSRTVRQATASRLTAVQPGPAGAYVDAGPVWRLIHGIVAAGYPYTWINRRLGQAGRGAPALSAVRVHHRTAARIRQIAEHAALNPGPSARARNLATRNGWSVELLWDDLGAGEDDDPADPLDEAVVIRACDGDRTVTLSMAERREAVRRLAASGLDRTRIAARLGIPRGTVGYALTAGVS